VWTVYLWWVGRRDKRKESTEHEASQRAKQLDERQAYLDRAQSTWVTDLREENKALREEVRGLRDELFNTHRYCDRGWGLARWWHKEAVDGVRRYNEIRHLTANLIQWVRSAQSHHRDLIPPNFSLAVPPKISLPMNLEDPKSEDTNPPG
jgi:hypothetical protein